MNSCEVGEQLLALSFSLSLLYSFFTFPVLCGQRLETDYNIVQSYNPWTFSFLEGNTSKNCKFVFSAVFGYGRRVGRFQILLDCLERRREFKTAVTLQHSLKFVFSGNWVSVSALCRSVIFAHKTCSWSIKYNVHIVYTSCMNSQTDRCLNNVLTLFSEHFPIRPRARFGSLEVRFVINDPTQIGNMPCLMMSLYLNYIYATLHFHFAFDDEEFVIISIR